MEYQSSRHVGNVLLVYLGRTEYLTIHISFKFLAHDDNLKRHQFSAMLVLLALDFT